MTVTEVRERPQVVDKAVLTIATGKPLYLRMAINLARSFHRWHRESDIKLYIATDINAPLPADLAGVSTIQLTPGQYGKGFSPKLHLDCISPARKTLFIDADCLCVGNVEPVFDKFRHCEVSVIGSEETDGEFFGDIASRCRTAGVPWIPRFCGAIYYFNKGPVSDRIFRTARELEPRYDDLGMVRLRGVPNEEPLIGLAMALADQRPIPDDGSIKADAMCFSARAAVDVLSGYARLYNSSTATRPKVDLTTPLEARPVIVHFNDSFAERPPYTTEAAKLEKVMRDGWPVPAASAYAWLGRTMPFIATRELKDLLRPLYRAACGYRQIKPSSRL